MSALALRTAVDLNPFMVPLPSLDGERGVSQKYKIASVCDVLPYTVIGRLRR